MVTISTAQALKNGCFDGQQEPKIEKLATDSTKVKLGSRDFWRDSMGAEQRILYKQGNSSILHFRFYILEDKSFRLERVSRF